MMCQGRFIFATDKDKVRAKKMGIVDLDKKYELKEIVKGDSSFMRQVLPIQKLLQL